MPATSSTPVRVIIVEDEPWIRDSLKYALGWEGSGTCHAGSASTGKEALRLIGEVEFDVALVDLGLPDMPGTDVISSIRLRHPSAASVVFTVAEDSPTILEAIRLGAQGYLLKHSPPECVLAGLRDAAAGGSPMTPSVARSVMNALRELQVTPMAEDLEVQRLTKRERQVLTLLAKGLTYSQTAAMLSIGLGTVQGHVKRIYEKLRVDSKAEAATMAQRMGLV